MNTMVDYRYTRHFKRKAASRAAAPTAPATNGEDLVLPVPVGTTVIDADPGSDW